VNVWGLELVVDSVVDSVVETVVSSVVLVKVVELVSEPVLVIVVELLTVLLEAGLTGAESQSGRFDLARAAYCSAPS
jgi:hypothetical protein